MVRQGQGMVGDVPSFGFGSACCIEDFLVGLFLRRGWKAPNQGRSISHFISFHVIGFKGREGKGRKTLLSEN
jgi:hypothetical protein